jgi:hypothetical protein
MMTRRKMMRLLARTLVSTARTAKPQRVALDLNLDRSAADCGHVW